jgi:eukaryotic-like serine/threonine-protein kinase
MPFSIGYHSLGMPEKGPVATVGRYAIHDEIASGGMATVYFGRLHGVVGFSKPVAIKKLHSWLADEPELVTMLIDEARMAARVQHPNVVPMLDVVAEDGQIFLVMEYVRGESLSRLLRASDSIPRGVAVAIAVGMLDGLHAAHEARDERGALLNLVHRDVSPQNVLVGQDGLARVIDFGVAKAAGRLQRTRHGQMKGKLAYIAPERLRGQEASRASDIFEAGVVLWEMLANRELFDRDPAHAIAARLSTPIEPPSRFGRDVPPALDAVVMRALENEPSMRFETARQMARELEAAHSVASASVVGEWVERVASESLTDRARKLADIEARSIATAVTSDAAPDESRPKRRWPVAVGVASTIAALGVIASVRSKGVPPRVAESAPSLAPPESSVSTPSVESAAPPVAPVVVTSAAHPTTRSQRRAPQPSVRPRLGATAKAIDCDPPFIVDGTGQRRYKPECL